MDYQYVVVVEFKAVIMNFVIAKSLLSQETFLEQLCQQFLEITAEITDEDYAGLIHLQIGCLARYANQLIQHGRFDVLRSLFSFFSNTVNKVDSLTENALYVSFLEHVEMDGDFAKAREARSLLPPEYLNVWKALRQ